MSPMPRSSRTLYILGLITAALLLVSCERGPAPEAVPQTGPKSGPKSAPRSGTTQPATPETAADLVLRGGKVVTVDQAVGEVEAVAVVGHEIMALGNAEDISALIGPDTQVIELNGRTVIPGFIEGHGHFLGLGWARQVLDFNDAKTWDDIVSAVAGAAEIAPEGAWISGRGWHQDKWLRVPETAVEGVPRNDRLNEVAPNNPVLLGHASGHAAIANDAALAAAGIGDLTEDPPGGTIVRDENGRATGLLRETAQR
ncbi:MAG: amidohydrolase family protein, partial [Xanthomonadales bacterium]|nr:amidohydrolase family protein [Xanthomonadales bacterium]